MITKDLLITAAQGIVNFYNGRYGKIKEIHKGYAKSEFCFKNKGWFKYDTDGIVYTYNKILKIFLPGTNNNFDWISNFIPEWRIIPYKGVNKNIKVRKGFLDGYLLMRDWWLDLAKGYDKIEIVCHSRGCPIGKLAAVDLQWHCQNKWNMQKEIIVIGFGSPATGNKYFEDSYIGRVPQTYLFKYGNDIVTYVPICGYKNGTQIPIGKPTWIIPNHFDHFPSKYLEGIKNFKL